MAKGPPSQRYGTPGGRFWVNVVLIALAHLALIAGLIPLECCSEGIIESGEHRVVGWRGRSLGRRIGKTGIANTKTATRCDRIQRVGTG